MSAELQARLTAAGAALADFRRWTRGELVSGDWQDWAQRLAAELESALTGLRGALEMVADGNGALDQLDTTGVRTDGGLSIASEDAETVAAALADAAQCGEEHAAGSRSLALAARYRDLASRIGDDE